MKSTWPKITVQELVDRGEAEVKTGPFGTQLHASDYVEKGTPVINARNIGFGDIRDEKLEYISPETVERLSSHLLKSNDIVFGRKGSVERHVFIRERQKNWFQGTDCLRLRIKSKLLSPSFASYYLRTDYHQNWIMNQSSHGATMTSLNQDIIKRISFPLPSPETQFKIVDILSAYDDLIENNMRRIKILEEMAHAIYREWFVEFHAPGVELRNATPEEHNLTGKDVFPKGWVVNKFEEVVLFQKGKKPQTTFPIITQGSIPYLLIDGIENNMLTYTNEVGLPRAAEDDVVMVMDGARSGLVFIGVSGAIGSTLGCFRTRDREILSPYILYMFLKERMKEIASKNIGAAIPHANKAYIFGLKIVLPAGTLNQSIHDILHPFFREIGNLKTRNLILRGTRDLLLPKLISGEVDVEGLDIRPESISSGA